MKQSIFFLVFFFSFGLVSAGELKFYSGTWQETQKKAKAENKYLMLDCYTDWCSWCKVMDKETFQDAAVQAEFEANFICSRREMEKTDEGRLLGLKYHIRAYPTYLFFSPEGDLIYIHTGYAPAKDFIAVLQKLRKKENQQSFPGLSRELNPGFPDFCTEKYDSKISKEKQDEIGKKSIAFLDSSKNLYSETSWAVMWRFQKLNEKYDNWIFQHIDTLRYLYGTSAVEIKLNNMIAAQVNKASKERNEALFTDAIAKCSYFGTSANSERFAYSLRYYSQTEDWKKLLVTLTAFADTAGYKSDYAANTLNQNTWAIYENCNDTAILRQAAGLMKKVCEAKPGYAVLDTYAALLYKSGNYAEAEIQAEKAIAAARAEKEDASATEDLLRNIRMKKK